MLIFLVFTECLARTIASEPSLDAADGSNPECLLGI